MEKTKTYNELSQINGFEDRFNYLKLHGGVGEDTFGFDRYMNQQFYRSAEWKSVRSRVIVRDGACDLGDPDHPITGKVYIHHMNPISPEDIEKSTELLLDMDNLICVSQETHNAIHYGSVCPNQNKIIDRAPNDQSPWRNK